MVDIMHHICDGCGRSVKEVGHLMRHNINRKRRLLLCGDCYKDFKKNKKIGVKRLLWKGKGN
jgi:predicted Fe-S protein YdhL (DUF1289 family)